MTGFRKILIVFAFSITFIALSLNASALCADTDNNGEVTVADARQALRIAVSLESADDTITQNCDLNYDGQIGVEDAREILRLSVGFGRSDDSCANGMPDAEFVGLTEKYYKIYRKDGIYYIDGIIVANKTYALPQSYDPGELTDECYDAYLAMKADATRDGEYFYISYGYRSYDYQQVIYDECIVDYGADEVDNYAALPGHSEHQTGLAIDLTNESGYFTGSSQAKYVHENCTKYGFILRYPEGKSQYTGFNAEAWHIRYVGTAIAEKIANSGLCLEEYYGITSAYTN